MNKLMKVLGLLVVAGLLLLTPSKAKADAAGWDVLWRFGVSDSTFATFNAEVARVDTSKAFDARPLYTMESVGAAVNTSAQVIGKLLIWNTGNLGYIGDSVLVAQDVSPDGNVWIQNVTFTLATAVPTGGAVVQVPIVADYDAAANATGGIALYSWIRWRIKPTLHTHTALQNTEAQPKVKLRVMSVR